MRLPSSPMLSSRPEAREARRSGETPVFRMPEQLQGAPFALKGTSFSPFLVQLADRCQQTAHPLAPICTDECIAVDTRNVHEDTAVSASFPIAPK